MLENFGLVLGLALLIGLALRGVNILFATLLCSAVVALSNGLSVAESLSSFYASGPLGAFTFAGKFFLLFCAGALFGRVMGESHGAASIAAAMTRLMGEKRVLWVVVLASALLTYGGVVVFVVIFTIYPLGLRLLKQANLPKRLLCGAAALGAGTFTMTALPGSPSIHNVIAASSLGTDLFAGAGMGLFAAALMFGLGMWYLEHQRGVAIARGEGFEAGPKDQLVDIDDKDLPHWFIAVAPLLLVLSTILLPRLAGLVWTPETMPEWLQFAKANPIIWPSFALLLGSIVNVILLPKAIPAPLQTFGQGVDDAIMPLLNTAAVIGFGAVVTKTAGFAYFISWFSDSSLPPLVSLFTSVSVVAGITASASGGLQIFMETLAPVYLNQGMDPEVLHRIVVIASGGIDSLPHSGAVIAMLTIMGLKHRDAYKDIAVVTVIIPVTAALSLVAYASFL